MALPDIGRPLAMIGAFGAFYGVAIGITQSRPKVVLAYSSVSQMGFVVAVIGMGLSRRRCRHRTDRGRLRRVITCSSRARCFSPWA